MEFLLYIFLIFIGSLILIKESNFLLKYIYIPFLFLFLFVVRLDFTDDIVNYANTMQSIHSGIYYYKEFIFWYTQMYLYKFLHSTFFVFLSMDIFWIFLLIKISKNNDFYKNKRFKGGLIIILVTSFPFFAGYENIYRQFFATIILLYSYSIIDKNLKKGILLYLIAIFIHNTAGLFLPFLLMNSKLKLKLKLFLSIVIVLFFSSLLNYASQFKSGYNTGIDTSILYLALILFINYVYMVKFKFNITSFIRTFPSFIHSLIYIIVLQFSKADMIAERLGMSMLTSIIFDIYKYSTTIEDSKYRIFLRLLLLFIFSLPVLVFSSTRNML
jgi:hypothetical protein